MRFKPNYHIERAERDRAKGPERTRSSGGSRTAFDDSAQQPAASRETPERGHIATSGLRGSGSEA
jgi:hypothetical protein